VGSSAEISDLCSKSLLLVNAGALGRGPSADVSAPDMRVLLVLFIEQADCGTTAGRERGCPSRGGRLLKLGLYRHSPSSDARGASAPAVRMSDRSWPVPGVLQAQSLCVELVGALVGAAHRDGDWGREAAGTCLVSWIHSGSDYRTLTRDLPNKPAARLRLLGRSLRGAFQSLKRSPRVFAVGQGNAFLPDSVSPGRSMWGRSTARTRF
jgi:hypothetical protein